MRISLPLLCLLATFPTLALHRIKLALVGLICGGGAARSSDQGGQKERIHGLSTRRCGVVELPRLRRYRLLERAPRQVEDLLMLAQYYGFAS